MNDAMRYDTCLAKLDWFYIDVYISIYGVLYEFRG